MKEDELPFIPEHNDVASKATMVFSCLNKQIQSFPIHSTFLVGTVAGCELRLAGLDLPALLFQVNYVKPIGLLVRSILKSNDKLNIGNYEFSFIVTDSLAAVTPAENIAIKIHDQSAIINKIKTKSKSKKYLSNLIKKLKNKNQLLKIELGSLLENNRTIAEREIETISKQSMLESEKSSITEQLNLQIIKNKTYAEEIVLLRNELPEIYMSEPLK